MAKLAFYGGGLMAAPSLWGERYAAAARIGHTSVMATGLESAVTSSRLWTASASRATSLTRPESSAGSIRQPSGFRDVRGRHFSLRRGARGQPARHGCSRGRCSAPPRPPIRPASWSPPPARGWPWRSAVPLMSGERVVGVFGLSRGTRRRAGDATSAPHAASGRGASPSGAGPLDEANRRGAPPEHRNGQKPHPAAPPGPRRPFPARAVAAARASYILLTTPKPARPPTPPTPRRRDRPARARHATARVHRRPRAHFRAESEAGEGPVGDRGFEPRTSALSERRSNRLS